MSTGVGDEATVIDPPEVDETVQLPSLAVRAAEHVQLASQPSIATPRTSSLSLTTAVTALRDEEVVRTRMFIRMG